MSIADETIRALEKCITGDDLKGGAPIAPYLGGPGLVDFFNALGRSDSYSWGGGFPSRWQYCQDCVREVVASGRLEEFVQRTFDPRRFFDTEFNRAAAAAYVNRYLEFDGFTVDLNDRSATLRVINAEGSMVANQAKIESSDPVTRDFMQQQLEKCREKMRAEDHDGAVTNARSLVEAVLTELAGRLGVEAGQRGDLPKLYKAVARKMNLDPNAASTEETLRPLLRSLVGLVQGVATARNDLGDAHARRYRIASHHARLAVNAAHTAVDFLLSSYEFQRNRSAG